MIVAMTSGNPAIGHEQGVGPQPYPPGQHPTVASSTLGGVHPSVAPNYRVENAEQRIADTVVPPSDPVVVTEVEDGEHYTTDAEPVTTEADPPVEVDPPVAPVPATGEQGEAGDPAPDGPNVTADGEGPAAGDDPAPEPAKGKAKRS